MTWFIANVSVSEAIKDFYRDFANELWTYSAIKKLPVMSFSNMIDR